MKVILTKRIEKSVYYFTTLAKETHEEKDNPHMDVTYNLTNHTGLQG